MLLHAATLLLSVGDIMGFDPPEQFTKHSSLPVDGGEHKFPRQNSLAGQTDQSDCRLGLSGPPDSDVEKSENIAMLTPA